MDFRCRISLSPGFDHSPVKHRYHPTLGFGEFNAAHRFCKAVDEVSNFLKPCSHMAEFMPLSDKRNKFIRGVSELEEIFQAA